MQDKNINISGHQLSLTHLDKVFWPESGLTKGDLIAYYHEISVYIIPHLQGRPESLNRFPDGITGQSFYQKNKEDAPKWMDTFLDTASEKEVRYVICNDVAGLLYLVNLGCIDLNAWNSRAKSPDTPDFIVFDLDPVDIDFKYVRETALAIHTLLASLGIKSYPKTSGKRGLHIYVPLLPKYTYDQARDFAHLISLRTHQDLPSTTSLERQPKDRQGKVYLDYLQNRRGATMAAPYSVRPTSSASVATPITWEELRGGAKPEDFTIHNVPARLQKLGDIFAPALEAGIDLDAAIEKLQNL